MTKPARIAVPAPDPRTIKARIKHGLAVWEDTGHVAGAVEIAPDGTIRIIAPDALPNLSSRSGDNSCDDLFGTESE